MSWWDDEMMFMRWGVRMATWICNGFELKGDFDFDLGARWVSDWLNWWDEMEKYIVLHGTEAASEMELMVLMTG